jgi:hypothetical protein
MDFTFWIYSELLAWPEGLSRFAETGDVGAGWSIMDYQCRKTPMCTQTKPVCHFGAGISLWHTISGKFSFVCVKCKIPDKTLENDV